METKEKKGLNISAKSFIAAILVILVLMIITYALTFALPGGEYSRIMNENGDMVIDTNGEFKSVEGGLPFWKWLLSPILVLGAEGSGTLIAVIAFLLVIGGVFTCLDKCGLMSYMLRKIVSGFGAKRYNLLAVVTLFFMAMGSAIGSFEECVPLVPIVCALSVSLGWDVLTGMGMSLLAVGCGFAAGVCNPFTVGVSQQLAGLPMFSGVWLRLVAFVLIYGLLSLFLRAHAKRVERPVAQDVAEAFARDEKLEKALKLFAGIVGGGILLVLCSAFLTFLQDYTMIIIALAFLLAGIFAPRAAGMEAKSHLKNFWEGVVSIAPAVIMILMASSIKYTLDEAHVMDSILHSAVMLSETMPRTAVILFIYAIALVMNFFISSGSAKAFLLMPLVVPLAQVFNISPQLCVMAYAFGDGFSNVFYPTNPVLLISLGLVDVSYIDWVKYSGKFQAANLVLTSGLLLLGLAIGYC